MELVIASALVIAAIVAYEVKSAVDSEAHWTRQIERDEHEDGGP